MNKYQQALLKLRMLEMDFLYKTTSQTEPQIWSNTVQELADLNTPKQGVWKYDDFGDGTLCCPNCENPIINVWSKRNYKPKYCHCCGQRLCFEEEEE